MSTTATAVALADIGVLRVSGRDARAFLQGQLSHDLERLVPGRFLLTGLHNPQGRCVALLHLTPVGDDVLALLPGELLGDVRARLARYVLRSRVVLEDASTSWCVYGLATADGRERVLLPAGSAPPAPAGELTRARWQLLDIAAGIPEVHLQTRELFVAQMLNLDVLDGISFSKGCYTGQEVIARAHYRGRVKRRMQRFVTRAAAALQPGEAATASDGRALRVVVAARHDDGRCEFLAVAPLAAEAAGEPADADADASAVSDCTPLPLPYPLPA